MSQHKSHQAGRGAQTDPVNRFDRVHCEWDPEEHHLGKVATQFLPDESKTIVSENDSPDLGFRYSLNAYRGCEHGCTYCYARPYHEFLGMNAGSDFETKILVKHNAPELFRKWLSRDNWQSETINMSGATDPYQMAERRFLLTRRCLEVAIEFGQSVTIVTKNGLVTRDLDLLQQLAARNLVRVNISITSLDQQLTRCMEPRTSSPDARLKAIRRLSVAGIPTQALLSPIIPGLNDTEIPRLVQAVSDAGVASVGSSIVRLPGAVRDVFFDWLQRLLPEQRQRVQSRIRQVRGGHDNDSRFGLRMSGHGVLADQIRQTFEVFARRYRLPLEPAPLDTTVFRSPGANRQLRLF